MKSKEKYVNQGTATLCPVSHLEKYHIVYRETKSRCRVYKHLLYVLRLSKIFKLSYQKAAEVYIRSLPRCRGGLQSFNYIDKYFSVNVSQYYFSRTQTHRKLKDLNILSNSWIREISKIATKELRQSTNLKLHGIKNYNNIEQIMDTNLKNLGVKNVMQDKTIAKRCRESMGDKYPLAQAKREATNKIKYGFKNSAKSPQVGAKISKSWKSKPQDKVQMIVDKRKGSMGDWKAKYRDITEKALRTKFNKRYGENFNKEYILENFVKDGLFLVKEFCDYFHTDTDGARRTKKFFGISQYPNDALINRAEEEFISSLEELFGIKIARQHKIEGTNFRTDGFIKTPDSKGIAVEYLGDFWHGRINTDKIAYGGMSHSELFAKTFNRLDKILSMGYDVVYVWDTDFKNRGLRALQIHKISQGV